MAILLLYKIVLVWVCLAWAPVLLLAMLCWRLIDGECGVSSEGKVDEAGITNYQLPFNHLTNNQ